MAALLMPVLHECEQPHVQSTSTSKACNLTGDMPCCSESLCVVRCRHWLTAQQQQMWSAAQTLCWQPCLQGNPPVSAHPATIRGQQPRPVTQTGAAAALEPCSAPPHLCWGLQGWWIQQQLLLLLSSCLLWRTTCSMLQPCLATTPAAATVAGRMAASCPVPLLLLLLNSKLASSRGCTPWTRPLLPQQLRLQDNCLMAPPRPQHSWAWAA